MLKLLKLIIFAAVFAAGITCGPLAFAQSESAAERKARIEALKRQYPYLGSQREPPPVPEGVDTWEIYQQLPLIDQEKLAREAEYVHNYCIGQQLFSYLHDCRCIASKAMDRRILDPESPKTIVTIGDEVADECPNAEGAAGYAYDSCLSTYTNVMAYGLEEFCICYANNFSRSYMKDPRSFMPRIKQAGVDALQACEEEGVPTPRTARR